MCCWFVGDGVFFFFRAVESHFDSAAGGETSIDLAVSRQGEGLSHEVGPHLHQYLQRKREEEMRGERE